MNGSAEHVQDVVAVGVEGEDAILHGMRENPVIFARPLSEESANHPSAVEAAVVDYERRILRENRAEMVRSLLCIEKDSHSSNFVKASTA